MAKRLKWLPLTREVKEHIVRANILPAGLYGVEAAEVNAQVLQTLRSAIARAIGPASGKRTADMAFACGIAAKDLDPLVHILYLRIAAIRRTMAKNPLQIKLVKKIFNK